MTAVLERPEHRLRAPLMDALPLLLAVGLLMAGNGLTSTLLGIRAGLEGFSPGVVGVVLTGYYLGFAAGSLAAPATIARVGHVRVFAGLASLASAAVLVHVVRPEPGTWFVLRAITGLCISGLYVVTETWLNGAATNRTRGSLFAIYMAVVGGSLLVGQVLFTITNPAGFVAFVFASVLVSLAVVPVSLATMTAPATRDPVPLPLRALVSAAPFAAVGAALSGFTGAAMIGAGVVYAAQAGFDNLATAAFISATLAGGLVLQIPLGAWSDRVDRRIVIALAAFAAMLAALAASMVDTDRRLVVIGLTTVAGGVTFPLYSLCNAHLNDYLHSDTVVDAGARMVLVNGVGAIAGPVVGASAVGVFGPGGLFVVVAVAYAAIGVFSIYRMTRRAAVPEEERSSFSPAPVGLGTANQLTEADVDELYPPTEGLIAVGGVGFTYREQGVGTPLILVHDRDEGLQVWEPILPAMAADGSGASPRTGVGRHRRRGGGAARRGRPARRAPPPGAPLGDLRGLGHRRPTVRRFLEEHPDRVDAIVLIVEPEAVAGPVSSTARASSPRPHPGPGQDRARARRAGRRHHRLPPPRRDPRREPHRDRDPGRLTDTGPGPAGPPPRPVGRSVRWPGGSAGRCRPRPLGAEAHDRWAA